jgi:hypothetical protein
MRRFDDFSLDECVRLLVAHFCLARSAIGNYCGGRRNKERDEGFERLAAYGSCAAGVLDIVIGEPACPPCVLVGLLAKVIGELACAP